MHPLSRAPTLLLLLALQVSAWAGPVPATEAEAAPAMATATLPGLSGPGLGEGPAAASAHAAASAAPESSVSELAAQMIKEADAGAATTEASHPPRRDNTRGREQSASASAPAGQMQVRQPADKAAGDPWGLRELGTAALHWAKNSLPWLADEESTGHDKQPLPDTVDWAAAPLAGGTATGAGPGANALPHAGPPSDLGTSLGYGGTDKRWAMGSDQNLVRVVMEALREVLAHPLTWLVAALFVVGGIVVKRIDRRPK